MKKRISVVLVVLGCAWALAGCGPKEAEKTSATTAATTTAATTVETSASKAPDADTSVQESVMEIVIDPDDLVEGQSQVISQNIEVHTGDL